LRFGSRVLDADIRAKEAAVKKQLERYRFGERA